AAAAARLKAIKEIDAAFTAENLSYVALKGAALMPYVFGQPQLRPMRDMDLLMPVAHLPRAEIIMRKLGYDLPKSQPSKYMRDMHQLPNASKKVDGFLISVELHNDGISREVPGHYYYPEGDDNIQPIDWDGFSLPALEDNQFCHQVSKHLEGLHNNAVLKLINVMDVIGLAGLITEKGGYKELVARYPHVENTLKCLHLLTPLPAALQEAIPELTSKQIAGPGQIMVSLRTALLGNKSLKERFKLLFMPSDWWLHLYYNRDPNKSLTWIKWFKHPARVINWLSRRIYSRILGG
ncbi:MAG: nucleotidyltransferase family protein, partial [Pseudomonadota bacterium]